MLPSQRLLLAAPWAAEHLIANVHSGAALKDSLRSQQKRGELDGTAILPLTFTSWLPANRLASTAACLTMMLLAQDIEAQGRPARLVGTWRVVRFRNLDSSGMATIPLARENRYK